MKRLKDLQTENARLRKAVSDLTLVKLILQEAAKRSVHPRFVHCGNVPLRPRDGRHPHWSLPGRSRHSISILGERLRRIHRLSIRRLIGRGDDTVTMDGAMVLV